MIKNRRNVYGFNNDNNACKRGEGEKKMSEILEVER